MQLSPTDSPFDIFSKINTAVSQDNIPLLCSEYARLEKSVPTDTLPVFISKQAEKFPLASRSLQRYRQLNAIDCIKLSDEDRACFALFIEKIIHNGAREVNVHLKKTAFSHPFKLRYSLQYNCDDKSTFLLLKRAGEDLLYSIATKKKATAAIQIPDNVFSIPVIVAQVVNWNHYIESYINSSSSTYYSVKMEDLKDYYKDVVADMKIHKEFSGKRGIWPLLGHVEYMTTLSNSDTIQKISAFSPLGRSTIEIVEKTTIVSINQLLDIAEDLSYGLAYFHDAGSIHGDLKAENALFILLPNDKAKAGLIDCGFSFKTGNPIYPYNEGYYGSLTPTAPELFGNKKFEGDIFKTEIWAFGLLFFELYFHGVPKWGKLLRSQFIESEVSEVKRETMKEEVKKNLEPFRKELIEQESLSIEEEFELLIYDAMRLEPDLRPTIQTIIERIGALKTKNLSKQLSILSIN